ncbi:MAG: XRE family transcriptional regulator [Chloroflexi bacterium]|nr:XRE family transcriptional regulator [Chloroflexota bacterium]
MNPEMVRLARRAQSLSQTELADRLGIAQPYISRFEAGIAPTIPAPITSVANALAVPAGLLTRFETVHDPSKATNHYRKKASVTKGSLDTAHARINLARIRIARLLEEVDLESPCHIPKLRVVPGQQTPEQIASAVRRDWQMPVGPAAHLVANIERAGCLVVPLDFGCDDIDAVHHHCPGLPPFFFFNSSKSADRIRFSLAHEIGHLVMHDLSTEAMEEEANQFAAELLMPADEVFEELSTSLSIRNLAHLKQRWRVSMQAIIFRAKEIGAITEARATNLFIELSRAGWRTKEPFPIAPECPALLRSICDAFMTEGDYSLEDLAKIAFCSVADIEEMIYPERRSTEIIQFRAVPLATRHGGPQDVASEEPMS